MKAFYLQIHEIFELNTTKQQFTDKQLPTVNFIDLYAGQDYNEEAFEGHLYPALYLQWNIDYKTTPATATVTVRLCYEQLRDTSNLGRNKDEALRFLDFIKEVDTVLKTIETDSTGKLSLVSEGLNIEDTIVDTYTLLYNCSYTGNEKNTTTQYDSGSIDDVAVTGNLYKTLLG